VKFLNGRVGGWMERSLNFVLTFPRLSLVLTVTSNIFLEVEIQKSLIEFNVNQSPLSLLFAGTITIFQYSKWVPEIEVALIVDFRIMLASVPAWMLPYSSVATGCAHRLLVTMNVEASQLNYNSFTSDLCTMVSPLQCHHLE
jgi:uncharacterized membrane protein